MVKWNIVAGDRNGDIYYIYNGRVPVRGNPHPEDPAYWDKPREGWTGDDEWERKPDGRVNLWAVADLPQVENCSDGYMANCNVSPWYVCPSSGIDPGAYPVYLSTDSLGDRQLRALELLDGDGLITQEEMRRYSRDIHIVKADKMELLFFSFYDPLVYPDLTAAADLLATSPNEAQKDNRSVALLYGWVSELGGAANTLPDNPALLTPEQKDLLVSTLRSARDTLSACPFGLDPEWGDIHIIDHGGVFPAAGGPNPIPTLFMVGGNQQGCDSMVGTSGSSFMQVTALGPEEVTSRSVRPIGSSDDPTSVHYNDETARFVQDDPEMAYKVNPFADEDILPGGVYWEATKVLEW
jgi:acyl-homoserine lactone acylase PvdQ